MPSRTPFGPRATARWGETVGVQPVLAARTVDCLCVYAINAYHFVRRGARAGKITLHLRPCAPTAFLWCKVCLIESIYKYG